MDRFSAEEIRAQYQWVRIVPISADIAWAAADLEAPLYADEATNQDRINSLAGDVPIAGAVEALGATVVTENVVDFQALGVPVDSYLE